MILRGRTAVLFLLTSIHAAPAAAQQWTADLYAGGARYDAVASSTGSTGMVGNIRLEYDRTFAYLSAAAPLEEGAPAWSAIGGGMMLTRGLAGGLRAGVDAGGDAYVFRYTGPETGVGATTRLHALAQLTRGPLEFQLRSGRRDHHADVPAGRIGRHLYEAGVRGTFTRSSRVASAEVRTVRVSGEVWPMAQVQMAAAFRSARVFAGVGHWFADAIDGPVWSAGLSVDAGSRTELWAAARRDVDPLYTTPARTAWNVGLSVRLGRGAAAVPAPVLREGRLIVRLPRSAAPDSAPAVAGEFSDWQPLPMQRAGDQWQIEIPAPPGVYRFAFVRADGEWFVPEGYPGRMDDDMGGHIAVVVVP